MRRGVENAFMKTIAKLFFISFFTLIFSTSQGQGQAQQKVGSWQFHLSYNDADFLVGSPTGSLFAKERNGIYYYSAGENALQELNLMDGISSQAIQTIGFYGPDRTLLIAHQNGLLNFVTESTISTFFGLANNEFLDDKTLHRFSIQENKIWLSGNFGFAKLDIENNGFDDSFLNLSPNGENLPVFGVCSNQSQIYLATPIGIRKAVLTSNLKDFRSWSTVSESNEFKWIQILNIGASILAQTDLGKIFLIRESGIEQILGLSDTENLKQTSQGIFFQMNNGVFEIDSNGNFELIKAFDIELADFWVNTDGVQALVQNEGLLLSGVESTAIPPGPTSKVKDLAKAGQHIYALSASLNNSGIQSSPKAFASKFEEGNWVKIDFPDSVTAIHEYQGSLYFGTTTGIWRLNESGAAVQLPLPSSDDNLPISALTSDFQGNLWVAISDLESRLFKISGEEVRLIEVPGLQQPKKLIADLQSRIWILQNNRFGRTLRLFFPDQGSSRSFGRSSSLGNLPDDLAFDILLDHRDRLWIGTARGLAFFPSASLIEANSPVEAILPRIGNKPVLEGESIMAISQAPDFSLYLGTEKSGLWHFDENLDEVLSTFLPENSPIPDRKINSLRYDDSNGQLFVLFPQGLMSYRTGIKGAFENLQTLKIFPNPVSPDFSGLITIEGLSSGVELLITDSRGRAVYQTFANGGSVTWDLISTNGAKLTTGVYFVYVLDQEGNRRESGKFLVI